MLEKDIQAKIISWLKKNEIFHFKIIAANKNGIPDLFLLYKSKPIFIEVKRDGGKVTELQEHFMSSIEEAGGFCKVVYSLKDLQDFLKSEVI